MWCRKGISRGVEHSQWRGKRLPQLGHVTWYPLRCETWHGIPWDVKSSSHLLSWLLKHFSKTLKCNSYKRQESRDDCCLTFVQNSSLDFSWLQSYAPLGDSYLPPTDSANSHVALELEKETSTPQFYQLKKNQFVLLILNKVTTMYF